MLQQQIAVNAGQRPNGTGIPQAQNVPQIRSQVNISQQQRTGTPSIPIGNTRVSPQQFIQAQQAQQIRAVQQQGQQPSSQAQSNVVGNSSASSAHLSPHGGRDITSSSAHVSPPHGLAVISNATNSPRPTSAQAHPLLQVPQVPGNTTARSGNYYFSAMTAAEQMQSALRLQVQVSSSLR